MVVPEGVGRIKTVQVKNGAELFWREEKRTKKIGEEN